MEVEIKLINNKTVSIKNVNNFYLKGQVNCFILEQSKERIFFPKESVLYIYSTSCKSDIKFEEEHAEEVKKRIQEETEQQYRKNSLKILNDFINSDKKAITVSSWAFYQHTVQKELNQHAIEVIRGSYFPRDGGADFTLIKSESANIKE